MARKTYKDPREHPPSSGMRHEGGYVKIPKTTIYKLAREGTLPATRVGREWRFSRTNLVKWIGNGTEADQIAKALRHGKIARRRPS